MRVPGASKDVRTPLSASWGKGIYTGPTDCGPLTVTVKRVDSTPSLLALTSGGKKIFESTRRYRMRDMNFGTYVQLQASDHRLGAYPYREHCSCSR